MNRSMHQAKRDLRGMKTASQRLDEEMNLSQSSTKMSMARITQLPRPPADLRMVSISSAVHKRKVVLKALPRPRLLNQEKGSLRRVLTPSKNLLLPLSRTTRSIKLEIMVVASNVHRHRQTWRMKTLTSWFHCSNPNHHQRMKAVAKVVWGKGKTISIINVLVTIVKTVIVLDHHTTMMTTTTLMTTNTLIILMIMIATTIGGNLTK
mmetsp:Transcript_51638/g.124675  ORF Transcript_51638/g.124675 Transcript_51638/m.124675 type:complete len:207 (+) Transcript_51638:1538-2158(+)